jgi:hypothetical protein
VTAAAVTIRPRALSVREDRLQVAALLAASAAVDAVAAGILLLGTPLPPMLEGLAAAAAHGMAALILTRWARVRPSRRWLGVAAVLAVPGVGAAVAATVVATRGRGSAAALARRRKPRRRAALTLPAMRRLADALSPSDALVCGDEERRRAALSALSRREDPEAIALLRRAAAGRDPDLALSAALVLDEIGERAERQVRQQGHAGVRRVPG